METADGFRQKIDEMDTNIQFLKKQVAGSEATNETKHKIEEMDASIKFLRKQAAEHEDTGCNAAWADPNVRDEQIEVALALGVEHDGMRAIAQGKKKQKELTDELGDSGDESLRLPPSGHARQCWFKSAKSCGVIRTCSPTCGRSAWVPNQLRSGVGTTICGAGCGEVNTNHKALT